MNKKLVLIDGHSILNRAFYGVPDLTNSEGIHTNAVYGFLNIMLKILNEEQPEYLIVAFDVKHPTFRHEMFAEYKGTRSKMQPELSQQVPIIKDLLKAMDIHIVEQAGVEADDILGSYATKAQEEGIDVCLVSGDRDTLQIASKRIQIRIPKTKKTGTIVENYYEQDVIETYGVTPIEFIDVKALMGDASDNIPGVPGIGEKTATAIIQSFGSIENAYAHIEEIKPNRARESLKENYDMAVLSKDLATIRTNLDLDYDWSHALLEQIFTKQAYELCKKYEFKNLLNKFEEVKEGQVAAYQSVDFANIDDAIKQCSRASLIGISVEKIQPSKAEHRIQFQFATDEVGYLYEADDNEAERHKITQWAEAICHTGKTIVSPNLKSVVQICHIAEQEELFDCKLAAYLLNPLRSEYQITLDSAVNEWASYRQQLNEAEMWDLYCKIELPLLFVLEEMTILGIQVQPQELIDFSAELQIRILELEKQIYQLAGEEFNINSPKQLGVVLFEKLQLPHGKKTKTGYSTSAEILDKLRVEAPIVSDILEYRQLTKLKSTYADGLGNYIGADGRIHGIFHQTIAATGRISSTEPNLQNIPIRMELGRKIRKAFVPKEGFVFVDADYSQIELRVLAHMSQDEELIQAYKTAQDIHRITASQVFHIPFDEVTGLQRRNAKAVNFGIVYGISAYGLSQDLEISVKEASEYIESYFATYPKIKEFLDKLVSDAKEQGYAKTLYLRRRPVPELLSSNFIQRGFGERIAMNSPIQGTAADIIKLAMIQVTRRFKKENMESRLVLQVHDELLIEAKKDEIERVKLILEEEMGQVVSLDVPLEIDVHEGKNWYDAK